MDSIQLVGNVDDQHRLSAEVPSFVPPGPVTVWIVPATGEEDSGTAWMNGIAHDWAGELGDELQDIYTLADGEAIDPA
ncbi:MAG: hypothetical protein WD669_08235 [Pirellulales bacterium]